METLHSLCFPDSTSASVKLISSIANTPEKCTFPYDYQKMYKQTKFKKAPKNQTKPNQTNKRKKEIFFKGIFFYNCHHDSCEKQDNSYTYLDSMSLERKFTSVNSTLLFAAPVLQWVYYNISNALIISGFRRKHATKGGLLCNFF